MAKPELPVDRGWAWLVMIGSFTNLLVTISFIRALSIIFPVLLEKYEQSVAFTTLAFGIAEIMESIANILIPLLFLPRFTVRTLCLCGSLVHALSIMGLAFTPNLVVLNILFGCIGFARGFIVNPQVYTLGCYFKTRLSFASACANMGISVATLLSPLATRFLLNTYELDWTFMLLGAYSLHSIVASLFFRPLSMYQDIKGDGEEATCMVGSQEKSSDSDDTPSASNSTMSENGPRNNSNSELLRKTSEKRESPMYLSLEKLSSSNKDNKTDALTCQQNEPVPLRKIDPNSKSGRVEGQSNVDACEMTNGIIQWLQNTWSESICSKPVAMLLIIASGLGVHTQAGNVYLPVLGLENGMTDNQLPWLLTITGATDILGKLTLGILADKNVVPPLYLACITQTIPGAALQLAHVYQGLGAMATLSVLYGLTAGILHILLPTLIIQMVGLPSLPRVISGYFLLNCVATFVMHVVVGALKDSTGSFVGGFRFVGCLFLASVLVLLLILPISKRGCWREVSELRDNEMEIRDAMSKKEDSNEFPKDHE